MMMKQALDGAWIQTYTGKPFWPLNPRPEDIDILDIAHALSMLCRFNGHCKRFYSVAEHSVHISRIVEPKDAPWGLLHDAAEAYLTDMPKPVKQEILHYQKIEDRLLSVIAKHFGLSQTIPLDIKRSDRVMLATEKALLMAPEPAPWNTLPEPLDPGMIKCWSPNEAKTAFLDRFKALFGPHKPI
ncbi:phosphohydrolase [Magnetococcales bacterium HHB-1]